MSAATVTTRPDAPSAGPLRALLRHRGLAKLVLLAVAAVVLVPLLHAKWSGGVWPGR